MCFCVPNGLMETVCCAGRNRGANDDWSYWTAALCSSLLPRMHRLFAKAPIALVTERREKSLVLAPLMRVFVFKERLDLAKLAATMMTLLGAAAVRFS